jgi:hypothetical protein
MSFNMPAKRRLVVRARALAAVALWFCAGMTGPSLAEDREMVFHSSAIAHGWVAGYADYPEGVAHDWNFTFGYERLPSELGRAQNAIYLSGDNHSDDLFMFLKRRITGLAPRTAYAVTITVAFATNAPRECSGIGGAPGESVFVKAGATTIEPLAVRAADGYYRMNIDKGNQDESGKDAATIGNIANRQTDCESDTYEFKTLRSKERRLRATTDSAGDLWLLVGTDSGFEGTTRIYVTKVSVVLRPLR